MKNIRLPRKEKKRQKADLPFAIDGQLEYLNPKYPFDKPKYLSRAELIIQQSL